MTAFIIHSSSVVFCGIDFASRSSATLSRSVLPKSLLVPKAPRPPVDARLVLLQLHVPSRCCFALFSYHPSWVLVYASPEAAV